MLLLVAVLGLMALGPGNCPPAAAVAALPGAALPTVVAPIPGSPLDAYDKQVPYDTGVHKIARFAAILAYALMTATVVLGVVLRMRYFQRVVNRSTVYGAHMTLALSALIFGGIHGMTFLYQPVWHIGTRELVLPFAGGLQRIPVGLGVLGTELAVAVGCSVWLQRRIGYHRWLRTHQLGYLAFALIWLHIILVHPEPRHFDLVAVGVAAGAGGCLLAFLIRVLPSHSRLRQNYPLGGRS
ncbi:MULTISPECIES: ferric reductase-like transmembrane domain-containing protein [unclassified Kitasatospora]|uniref:ferric reductase-like transmembrane domain-containing protein n=1 Tax=unclassified Kitasatospora TaxID=2633591 RepID=UPI0024749B93|nr:ferric reductase-like transmembrane domain-containing protein [Kitasatospora sp. MAP12-44]